MNSHSSATSRRSRMPSASRAVSARNSMPVLQDLNQLKALYKERWETFLANAGVVMGFAPSDLTTAEWMSRRSGDTTIVAKGYNHGDSSNPGGQGMSGRFELPAGQAAAHAAAGIDGPAGRVRAALARWHLEECAVLRAELLARTAVRGAGAAESLRSELACNTIAARAALADAITTALLPLQLLPRVHELPRPDRRNSQQEMTRRAERSRAGAAS